MKTYHAVASLIYDERVVINYIGPVEVDSETLPKTDYTMGKHKFDPDRYTDYFNTEDEAYQWVEEQKNA